MKTPVPLALCLCSAWFWLCNTPAIIRYLEDKGISWVAWCFEPEWGPTMLQNWDYALTSSGEFFKKAMRPPAAP